MLYSECKIVIVGTQQLAQVGMNVKCVLDVEHSYHGVNPIKNLEEGIAHTLDLAEEVQSILV